MFFHLMKSFLSHNEFKMGLKLTTDIIVYAFTALGTGSGEQSTRHLIK